MSRGFSKHFAQLAQQYANVKVVPPRGPDYYPTLFKADFAIQIGINKDEGYKEVTVVKSRDSLPGERYKIDDSFLAGIPVGELVCWYGRNGVGKSCITEMYMHQMTVPVLDETPEARYDRAMAIVE